LDVPRHMSVAGMRALVDSYAPFGPLVFMAIVVAGLFTRVPMIGTALIAVGGVLFGGLSAFAYGWLGSLVGTTAIFLLVRYVARDYVQRALHGRSELSKRSMTGSPATASGPSWRCDSSSVSHRCSIGGLA
jgi:uncharacterized membrane protein YdjX (TVP38/TMEM64 family)